MKPAIVWTVGLLAYGIGSGEASSQMLEQKIGGWLYTATASNVTAAFAISGLSGVRLEAACRFPDRIVFRLRKPTSQTIPGNIILGSEKHIFPYGADGVIGGDSLDFLTTLLIMERSSSEMNMKVDGTAVGFKPTGLRAVVERIYPDCKSIAAAQTSTKKSTTVSRPAPQNPPVALANKGAAVSSGAASSNTSVAPAGNKATLGGPDIAGIHIGESYDNAFNAAKQIARPQVMQPFFTRDTLNSIYTWAFTNGEHLNGRATDRISIWLSSPSSGNTVLAMHRALDFTSNGVSADVTEKNLIEKYGKPSFSRSEDRLRKYDWIFVNGELKSETVPGCSSGVGHSLGYWFGSVATVAHGDSRYGPMLEQNPRRQEIQAMVMQQSYKAECGTHVEATIVFPRKFDGSGYRQDIVEHLSVSITDDKAIVSAFQAERLALEQAKARAERARVPTSAVPKL